MRVATAASAVDMSTVAGVVLFLARDLGMQTSG
jgi:hypothetical protein